VNKAVIIAGPTASGKSALALKIAETFDGTVINADSMQVYDGLRILTARPSIEDERHLPHRLYGVLPPEELCSAGRWRAMAVAACEEAWQGNRLPIVIGGTGLYLRALTQGLSAIPDVPDALRQDVRQRFATLGNQQFHAELAKIDPVMAGRLHPSNSQRLMRAWEVWAATGRSLADWQAVPPDETFPGSFLTLLFRPNRDRLYADCDRRFAAMIGQGALEEVKALVARGLDPTLPAMRALGVGQLAAHLRGEISLEAAVSEAQQATRHYAKRQMTWFRHQLAADHTVDTQLSESLQDEILSLIRRFLLTEAK
jgi:tRNA dimethylallyltransferase